MTKRISSDPASALPGDPDAALTELAARGFTRAGAARCLGLSIDQVEAFSARHPAVVFRKRDGRVDFDSLPTLAAQGLTMMQAAAALGVVYQRVYRWAGRNPTVRFADCGSARAKAAAYAPALRRAAADGLTLPEAAKLANVSCEAARNWLAPDQLADYQILTIKAQYPHYLALRMVQTPKVQIRFATRRMGDAPISVLGDAPISVLGDAPISVLGDAPISVLADAPISVLGDAPISVLGDAPISVAGLSARECAPCLT